MKTALLPTRNPLKATVRRQSVGVLNPLVADLFDLYARIKQAHWNLRGSSFVSLHKLLDDFAANIQGHIDRVAERATALGGVVDGTLRDAARKSQLGGKEEPTPKNAPQMAWLEELADSYARCGERVSQGVKETDDADDFVTADLLTDVLHDLDKHLWLIESHLNR